MTKKKKKKKKKIIKKTKGSSHPIPIFEALFLNRVKKYES